jgi:hypothetical protein
VPWDKKLIGCTGIVHFDLDHLDNPEGMKALLAQHPSVVFAFLSPAYGLKIGVATNGITSTKDYKHAWAVVLASLKRTYPDTHFNEDQHVKFLNALCYVSYDPFLHVNGDTVPFVVSPPAPKPTPKPAPKPAPKSRPMNDTPDYVRVASALTTIPNNDADYDTWLLLGMALHSTGEGWARDLWDSWSRQSGKFDAAKQEKSWRSFTHEGTVTIASLFYLAKQAGWQLPRQTPEERHQWRLRRATYWRTHARAQHRPLPTMTIEETVRWRR